MGHDEIDIDEALAPFERLWKTEVFREIVSGDSDFTHAVIQVIAFKLHVLFGEDWEIFIMELYQGSPASIRRAHRKLFRKILVRLGELIDREEAEDEES